jgi:hypothetical protein
LAVVHLFLGWRMRINKKIIPKNLQKKKVWVVDRLIFNQELFQRIFSYSLLLKLQRYFLSKPLLQKLFFLHRVELMKKWAEQCSIPEEQNIILRSLMANTWVHWRTTALSQPEAFYRWIKVQGIDILQNVVDQHQGVIILFTHSAGMGLDSMVVNTYTSVDVCFVWGDSVSKGRSYVMAAFAQQFVDALKTLRRGGIVFIAGEGQKGDAYLRLPLSGHIFPYHSGFAELAVRTGARTLALFDYLDLDGHLTFEFVEILRPSQCPKEMQVDSLVRQYAQILGERWPRLLSSIRWHKLKRVMDFPAISD